ARGCRRGAGLPADGVREGFERWRPRTALHPLYPQSCPNLTAGREGAVIAAIHWRCLSSAVVTYLRRTDQHGEADRPHLADRSSRQHARRAPAPGPPGGKAEMTAVYVAI